MSGSNVVICQRGDGAPEWVHWVAIDGNGSAHAFDYCPRYDVRTDSWRRSGMGQEMASIASWTELIAVRDLEQVRGEGNGRLYAVEPKGLDDDPVEKLLLAVGWMLTIAALVLLAGLAPGVWAWLTGTN